MAEFRANAKGEFHLIEDGASHIFRCALGQAGLKSALEKREGDGASPIGFWPFRHVFYRADRLEKPVTDLPVTALQADDGWCDAPENHQYNKAVKLPYPASHERLWRSDAVYDLIIVLGFNDEPVISGRGSAIFLHLARETYTPTRGCIALNLTDMKTVLSHAGPQQGLRISP